MATSQQYLFADNSTIANYTNWASQISAQLASFGWAQSNDTGQVMWTSMNLTAVSMSGSNATYSYNSLTGLPLAVGRAMNCTGMTNAGNNKTVVITSFTGTTSGTFTVVNASGVNETGSTGAVTAQASAPGTGAFFYEIWTPNDGLTAFFLKLSYGNFSGMANGPCIQASVAISTNGAGTLTGTVAGVKSTINLSTGYGGGAGAVPYECNFSGASSRFFCMMWRNAPNDLPQCFGIERSVNSSGTYTGSYVTFFTVGHSGSLPTCTGTMTTFYFSTNTVTTTAAASTSGGIPVLTYPNASATMNQSIAWSPVQPYVGFFDWPTTILGYGYAGTLTEAVPFQTTLYGSTRTYLPSAAGTFSNSTGAYNGFPAQNWYLCMRWD